MTFDYFFWFSQPSTILSGTDQMIGYVFAGLTVLSVILFILAAFIKHRVVKKLLNKFAYLFLSSGLTGLLWFGMRYENTPIFARRYWAGLTILLGLVWLVFILKYVFVSFREEKAEYDKAALNSRYLPGSKR